MGFGSGGGGFTPSPNNVPGSTKTGTDKDTDTHQFTGSVDITGSLTLNGSPVGGGGGGTPGGADTQVQFNDAGSFGGSANFTFDGNTITVSDDADVAATFGKAKIGYNGTTADTAIFAHRDKADTSNYALSQNQNGDTVVNASNGRSVSLRLNNNNALVVAGAVNNNIGINTGSPQARLHVSANTNEKDVFRADGDINNILYVTGSGQVGIGTDTPDSTLEILSTSTQQKWSYDADSFATLTVADGGDTTLSSSEGGNITLDADDIFLMSNGGQVKIERPGGSTRLQFDVSTSAALIDNPNNNDIAFRLGAGLDEIARFDQSEDSLLMATDSPVQFRDTATKINSPASNRLAITAPTLEVSGNLHVSGTYGSTAIETLTANGTISANTGLTLIDASSSLAVNNTLLLSIANGTFAGQEKKIRGLIISGSDAANSTGIYIFGSNIDAPPSLGANGQILLSSSNPAAGPSFQRAGCSLVWDGSKWLPVGNYNFNINNTGF
jgi:hypothetical protein